MSPTRPTSLGGKRGRIQFVRSGLQRLHHQREEEAEAATRESVGQVSAIESHECARRLPLQQRRRRRLQFEFAETSRGPRGQSGVAIPVHFQN